MAGTLILHSSGDGSLLSGHSWIEYKKEGAGESITYGTWGNNPWGKGNGLHENLEQGMKSEESRTVDLDDHQEDALFLKIQEYRDRGLEAWGYLHSSSAFAADAWKEATGEALDHKRYGISNPSELKDAMMKANRTEDTGTDRASGTLLRKDDFPKRAKKGGSGRKVKDGVQRSR